MVYINSIPISPLKLTDAMNFEFSCLTNVRNLKLNFEIYKVRVCQSLAKALC